MSFTEPPRSSEQEFLRRLRRGDNDAWVELSRSYAPRLYRYLQHNLPSHADAEDALGETMLAAVRAVPNFDGGVPLSAFLFSLAYRKVADFWRSRRESSQLGEQIAAPRTEETARAEFEELLNELPELSRQVLILRYVVGLSVTEIADVIGRSYKGTESLLSRSREQLRTAVKAAGIDND